MLYERWRQTARQFAGEMALRELPTGRRWTFDELAQAAENYVPQNFPTAGWGQPSPTTMVSSESLPQACFPQGNDSRFVLEMLAGWREHRVVCPLEPGQDSPVVVGPVPNGIVHLKTTSASTGAPRMVAFTAEQLVADALNIVLTMGLRPEWPNLGLISLAHSYGFSNLVLLLVLHGIPLFLVGAALPEALRQACGLGREFTVAAVPALWRTWHEANVLSPAIRLAISAGAPLPLMLEEAVFSRTGIKIHNFYGSSECGGIAYDPTERPRSDSSLAGAPMKNVEVSVGPEGCLEVRSRAVGQGYWPQASDRLQGGTFYTSDLAELAGGRVYLRGRSTDLINVAGRKVSPEVIEQTLARHPLVRDCLVFGVPSSAQERGDKIVAALRVEGAPCGDLLRSYLSERLPAWQLPREWWFVDSLDINQRGKISRAEMKGRYLQLKNGKR